MGGDPGWQPRVFPLAAVLAGGAHTFMARVGRETGWVWHKVHERGASHLHQWGRGPGKSSRGICRGYRLWP